MKLLKNLFIFLSITVIGSCIDPFNFDLPEGAQFLVVDGEFSPANRAHQVKLYYTNGQRIGQQIPVEDASLWLVDADNNKERYQHINQGIYEVAGTEIKGVVGATYHLEIELENGTQYLSKPEKMPPLIKGNSVQLEFEVKQAVNLNNTIIEKSFVVAYVNTSLPTDTDYWLRWDVSSIYSFPEWQCNPLGPPADICYVSQTPNKQQVTLLNGENFNASSIEKLQVADKILTPTEFEFRGRHYFLVNQQSITEQAHNYWANINQIANQSGSIFDPPPAAIRGNIYNPEDETEMVLGYFELLQTDSLRSYVTKIDLDPFYRFTEQVCPNAMMFIFPFAGECCDCERIENSSLERPVWW